MTRRPAPRCGVAGVVCGEEEGVGWECLGAPGSSGHRLLDEGSQSRCACHKSLRTLDLQPSTNPQLGQSNFTNAEPYAGCQGALR